MKPFSQRQKACGPTIKPEAKLASQCYSWQDSEASHRASASVKARVLTEGFTSPSNATNPTAVFPKPGPTLTRKARSTALSRTRQSRQADFKHVSDMDPTKVNGNVNPEVPVHSVRIRVGRSIQGFGLSPGITKEQRVGVEKLVSTALKRLDGDLAGAYYPLTGMDEKVRQQLVDDHFLFMSGDPNLKVAGMERDWPEGRGIFHNAAKTFLVWINEEDQLRIISMQKGGDVKGVFERLARGIAAVGESIKAESGKDFLLSPKFGYIHSCPTNLGTGMRASVHVDLPGWTKDSIDGLKARCEALCLQPRGTRGESGGQTGHTYDISNKHRLGYSEVQLVQTMIDGVNTLWKEDLELQKKHGM